MGLLYSVLKLCNRTQNNISIFTKPTQSLIFHSDQGSQFKAQAFRKILDENNILASYSKPGYPYDNSVTEVFFKCLKLPEINRKTFGIYVIKSIKRIGN